MVDLRSNRRGRPPAGRYARRKCRRDGYGDVLRSVLAANRQCSRRTGGRTGPDDEVRPRITARILRFRQQSDEHRRAPHECSQSHGRIHRPGSRLPDRKHSGDLGPTAELQRAHGRIHARDQENAGESIRRVRRERPSTRAELPADEPDHLRLGWHGRTSGSPRWVASPPRSRCSRRCRSRCVCLDRASSSACTTRPRISRSRYQA